MSGWILCALWVPATHGADLIPPGSSWNFFLGTTEASSPDTSAWRGPGFDDISWSTGTAPIGYGEPDVVTTIPEGSVFGYSSVFFRKSFTASNVADLFPLDLSLVVDDGAIVWINGTEVGRTNVPAGDLPYNSMATTAGERLTYDINLPSTLTNLLQAGSNILAVQVFNANLSSSDLLFDASLSSSADIPPTILQHPAPLHRVQNAMADFSVVANGTPPSSYQWRKDGLPIPMATNDVYAIPAALPADAGQYDVVIVNSLGQDTSRVATLAVLNSVHVAENLLVNLDATSLEKGPLPVLANAGSGGGFFEATGGSGAVPYVISASGDGTRAILFDGNMYMEHVASAGGALLDTPPGLVGPDPTSSIEVWVLNVTVPDAETILSWGRRGGPVGSMVSLNYGTHPAYGAVTHWTYPGPDLGWNDAGGAPVAGRWHHLVYTYDGTTTRVYSDGALMNSEVLGAGVMNPHPNGIVLGAQRDANEAINVTYRGSLLLGRVRIHDGVLSDSQILENYTLEASDFSVGTGQSSAVGLVHRYSFNESPGDASGQSVADAVNGENGVVLNSIGTTTFTGTKLTLSGGSSTNAPYVDLPNGLLSRHGAERGGSGEVTVEGWVRQNSAQRWARIFDFGSTPTGEVAGLGGESFLSSDSFMLTMQVDNDTRTRRGFLRNNDPVARGYVLDYGSVSLGADLHFVVTWNESTGLAVFYENGFEVASLILPVRFTDITDYNMWLGRANYSQDQNLHGDFDEFRIYNRVLSAEEVQGSFVAGPDAPLEPPLSMLTQPMDQVTGIGHAATFSATVAGGTGPRLYQWQHNSTDIPGATASTYTIPSLQAGDAGNYDVAISDSTGSVTSRTATLTLVDCAEVPPGLAAWWPGEGNAAEFLGRYHGTLVNGVSFAEGKVGQAFEFDGLDDHVATELDVNTIVMNDMTWEGWVYPTRVMHSSRQSIFSSDDGGWDRGLIIEFGTATFGVFTGSGEWYPVAVSENQWQHVAVVYTRTNMVFYKDGVRFSSDTPPQGQDLSFPLNLGRNPGFGEYFQGRIDEASVYARALTDAEIQGIYNAGGAGKCNTTYIATHPQPRRVRPGDDLTLTVEAVSSDPITYQWLFNGEPLAGQISSNLVLNAISFADAGSYFVEVTDSTDSQTSLTAAVAVLTDPEAFTLTHFGGLPSGHVVDNGNGSFTMEGGGRDVWDVRDNFDFYHRQASGDFDVRIRLQDIEPTARWARAGLMARERLTADSRMATVVSTPPDVPTSFGGNGQNEDHVYWRTGLLGVNGANGGRNLASLPGTSYPNNWLRLRRQGSVLSGYRGTNGVDWDLIRSLDTVGWNGGPLPADVEVGLVVTPHHGPDSLATAEFRDFSGDFNEPPVIIAQPLHRTVTSGSSVLFSIALLKSDVENTFQWRKDGVALPGAISSSLLFPSVSPADAGSYEVVVVNPAGTTTSDAALLVIRNTSVLPPGLAAWWLLEGVLTDAVGAHTPSPSQGVSYTHGKIGSGLSLATNGFIEILDSVSLSHPHFTLQAWVRPDGPSNPNDSLGAVILAKQTSVDGVVSAMLSWRATDDRFVFSYGAVTNDFVVSSNSPWALPCWRVVKPSCPCRPWAFPNSPTSGAGMAPIS